MKKENSIKVTAIILTGGEGKRFSTSTENKLPKQFACVNEAPLFIHCINKYSLIKEVSEIYLVINKCFSKEYEEELKKHNINNIKLVIGGETRLLSIINAMHEISDANFIVIQNGVNPVTSIKLVKKCIKTAYIKKAVTAYIPSFFTNILIKKNEVIDTIDRKKIGYTTDPQVYDYNILKSGIEFSLKNNFTDLPTVQLIKKIGQKVFIVKSDQNNVKVTLKNDIKSVEAVLSSKKN